MTALIASQRTTNDNLQ